MVEMCGCGYEGDFVLCGVLTCFLKGGDSVPEKVMGCP